MPTWYYVRKNWHWLSKTPFYKRWECIYKRCYNKNSEKYRSYGGRWITCEWKNFMEYKNDMYESFLEHVEKFWLSNTSIERINNNGNYSKDNCRWATRVEQQRNTRSVMLYKGKSLLENCRIHWMIFGTVYSRIIRWWDYEKALTTPPQVNKRYNKLR